MAANDFQSFGQFFRRSVRQFTKDKTWFENKCPNREAFLKNTEKVPITEKGFRIPYVSRRPGGHTAYLPSASSFNAAVAPRSTSMYVFPTRYALPIVMEGALIRGLMAGQEDKKITYNETLSLYMEAATKRLEYMTTGDGSGALAVISNAVNGAGVTVTFYTAAAAGPGYTKGALRLEEGHTYDMVNTSTGAVAGTLTVVTEGTSSAVCNTTAATADGYVVTDVGAYNKFQRGLGHLISKTSRLLQGLNTANHRDLNSPEVDLNGVLCTPSDFDNAKAYLQTRNNEETAENQLVCHLTFGFYSTLKKQGWNLTQQETSTTRGIAKKYVDGDTIFIRSADMDEDRAYLYKPDAIKLFEEQELDDLDLDGQELRMLMGTNSTGSDDWQKAIGCAGNPGIVLPRAAVLIKRALTSGQATQVTSF